MTEEKDGKEPKEPIITVIITEDGKWWKNTVYKDKCMGIASEQFRAISIGLGDERTAELANAIDSYRGLNYRQLPRSSGSVDVEG